MPATLLVCIPLLFAPAQPPGDGLAPPVPGQEPPQPDSAEVDPFDNPPAGEDPFANPPAGDAPPALGSPEPSVGAPGVGAPGVGAPMEETTVPGVGAPQEAPPVNPLLQDPAIVAPTPNVDVPLDPRRPDVIVTEDPVVTVITQPTPLAELIRNPYDIYDLRDHVAIPADCLLARQACLPCTRCVTTCSPCGCGGVVTQSLPVPGVNPHAAEQLGQILLERTPSDPRVSYLMFVLRYRDARYDEAFEYLEEAVLLEQAAPDTFPNYDEFMTPIQGRSRVYLERVRRLAGLGII
ncbi:hypothetical protein [Alienimonas chondri]|uniref:Tetratricopeptide repeat protein n=1 Tax=Alienimonas chondri TaxID=2681879 RepID=A0ABX1V909_9PLAN|nr:hypothetical protein [Alienimonas chondri]NNJ24050.1 hypothetical protein [Alienimonas chondri]